MAAGHAIWRGRRAVVPPLAKMPRRGSSMPNTAFGTGDADVGAIEQFHAPGDARSVHRGDDRLVDLEVAQHRLGARLEAGASPSGRADVRSGR